MNSFFLTDNSGVVLINTIEINHTSFSTPFLAQCDYIDKDLTIQSRTYKYHQFEITKGEVTSNLEQSLTVSFDDYDDELKNKINAASSISKMTLIYKIYREDSLSSPLDSIQTLEIPNVNYDSNGNVTFEARAQRLNSVATGLVYTINDYPLLKGVASA